DVARSQYAVDGTGVTACAISDSVDELAQLQATGELPGDVFVLPGQAGVGTSEGTALLEIIHDLAPGASLGFARAGPNAAVMAANIRALRLAGCDVIIDDAYFLTEPVFQPGVIGQAIDDVVADGAIYVTAAGNFFNLDAGLSGVWEGLFTATALPPLLVGAGIAAHDFGGTAMTRVTTDGACCRFPFSLQWANPSGQAADDLDLFLLSPGLTAVLDASTTVQDGDDDALEILLSAADRTNAHLVVVKFSGNDVYFHLNTNGSLLSIGTDRQSVGHGGSLQQISVGAVGVHTLGPGAAFVGGAANPPEFYSSDGFRRVFFDRSGNPLGARMADVRRGVGGVELLTPEVLAADRVSTTTTQWQTFRGTSASAPHVAAMAALYRQRFPQATADQFRQALIDHAIDTGTPGFDRTAGGGIAMMPEMLAGDFRFEDSFEDPAPR
ncbi:MAG: S8 family serine peptidase, partial [Xanthomonadales bacterium]|nr:S8 family serine peptidase [Xanthomonadales bacterium]